jgi:hypothetical protein
VVEFESESLPGLGCDKAQGSETQLHGLLFSFVVVVVVVVVGSDNWGCRSRSGYSTVVYGIGSVCVVVLQCAVCSAVQQNKWQTQKITGVRVKTGELPTTNYCTS